MVDSLLSRTSVPSTPRPPARRRCHTARRLCCTGLLPSLALPLLPMMPASPVAAASCESILTGFVVDCARHSPDGRQMADIANGNVYMRGDPSTPLVDADTIYWPGGGHGIDAVRLADGLTVELLYVSIGSEVSTLDWAARRGVDLRARGSRWVWVARAVRYAPGERGGGDAGCNQGLVPLVRPC